MAWKLSYEFKGDLPQGFKFKKGKAGIVVGIESLFGTRTFDIKADADEAAESVRDAGGLAKVEEIRGSKKTVKQAGKKAKRATKKA